MRLRFAFAISALLGAYPVVGWSQTVLSDDATAMKWDAAKNGPLLVVEPERTVAVREGGGLASFARRRVTVRGLTAIVPTQMTLVMENPPEGNLVDGLPRNTKVLYLLTKLTPAQWKTISTKGIGRDELSGEARDVFDSLLPAPFAWQRFHVTDQRRTSIRFGDDEKGVLSDQDRVKVRLRVVQSLNVRVAAIDRPTSIAAFPTDREFGREGDVGYSRDETYERDRSELFGVGLRTVVENRLKASHLAYRDPAFDAPVPISSPTTVKEILRQVQAATGKEVLADLRVSDRAVTFFGTQARAGDVLEALALAVTGTFRRVQEAYVLTSDLDGMGARKLRLALWAQELSRKTKEWEKTWTQTLAAQDIQSKVQFDLKDPFAPPEALKERLKNMGSSFQTEPFATSELGPELQDFLKRAVSRSGTLQNYDITSARVSPSLLYGFILPNGTPMRTESVALGSARNFSPGLVIPPRAPQAMPEGPISIEGKRRLIVQVVSAAEAKQAVEIAKARGFDEIWLETASPAALRAGLESGFPVRWVLRPWQANGTPNPADQTILGDAGPTLAKRAPLFPSWATLIGESPEARPRGRQLLVPKTPEQKAAWSAYEKLAATPGLAGTVMLDVRPAGYDAMRPGPVFRAGRETAELVAFGYSPAQRLLFLREKGIDPIDIATTFPAFDVDLRQPFFLDHAQASRNIGSYMYDAPPPRMGRARIDWDKYRSDLVEGALQDLYARLGVFPLLRPDDGRLLVPHAASPSEVGTLWIVLPEPSQVSLPPLVRRRLSQASAETPIAVDASGVPVKRLKEALDRWQIGKG